MARVIRRDRPALHREQNDAATRMYGRDLRAITLDWAKSAEPVGALSNRLQDAATIRFVSAYLSGKRQAYPMAGMTRFDWMSVHERLARNASFVSRGLVLDIQRKLNARGANDAAEREQIVNRSFGARVENLYGGVLWSIHELGYLNGWRQLARYTRLVVRRPLLQQDEELGDAEDGDVMPADDGSEPVDDGTNKAGYAAGLLTAGELALALGISIGELNSITEAALPVVFGEHYEDAGDEEVCDPCQENADENDGDYWEPETAPLPGDNCRGGGNCRCSLSAIWQFGYAA